MRLAQITDLHLAFPAALPHSENTQAFSAATLASFYRALDRIAGEHVDLIALTGDILDIQEELFEQTSKDAAKARELEEEALSFYRQIKSELSARFATFLVLPGNHDQWEAFEIVFGEEAREMTIDGYRCISFWDRERAGHVPERLGDERLRFVQALKEGLEGRQIHFQHFPIEEVDNSLYPYNYRDHGVLQKKILVSGKVLLCLSGHFHPGTELVKTGPTYFKTCPAFCEPGHPFCIYSIEDTSVSAEILRF
jgi:predicted MPP superfamily phosphohydrolase